VARYVIPVEHRPSREGTTPSSRHVPFYLALETAADAWLSALEKYCAPAITPADLAVVHVSSDFRRELFIGELAVDVAVAEIRTRSFVVRATLEQYGTAAGDVEVTFALVENSRTSAVPMTAAQRAVLEQVPPT
jgi:acyl-CoA thioesterase FadM